MPARGLRHRESVQQHTRLAAPCHAASLEAAISSPATLLGRRVHARRRSRPPTELSAPTNRPVRISSPGDHLECEVGEPLWLRQCRSVGVDHRGRYAVGEPRCSTGREGAELVEVHHAKSSQRIGRAIELAVSSNPRVDGVGRWEPGLDREVHRLGRCLICQEVGCGAGGVGLQAQGGADRVARANGKGDLRPGVDPNQARNVLGGIDRHFHVDVEETEAEEGMEVVRKRSGVGLWLRSGTVQVPDRMVIGAGKLSSNPHDTSAGSPKPAATGSVGLSARKKLGLQVVKILVAARNFLPQRRWSRLRSGQYLQQLRSIL